MLLYVTWQLKISNREIIEPTVVFSFSLILILSVISIRLVEYEEVLRFNSFIYLLLGFGAFIAGMEISRKNVKNCRTNGKLILFRKDYVFKIILILGGIYFLMSLSGISNLFSSNVSLLDMRQAHLKNVNSDYGVIRTNTFKSILQSIAIISFITLPITLKMKKIFFYLSLFSGLGILISTAEAGGRTLFVYSLLLMLFIFFIEKKRRFYNRKLFKKSQLMTLGVIGVIAFYFLFGVFPGLRQSRLVERTNIFLDYHHPNAKISSNTEKLNNITGLDNSVLAFGTTYLCSPIVKFNFYINEVGVQDWYIGGRYSFPILVKLITGSNKSHQDVRDMVRRASEKYKTEPNPWSSSIRDLALDFGLLGAFIISFLTGIIVEIGYLNIYIKSRLSFDMYILAAFSILTSFLFPIIYVMKIFSLSQTLFLVIILVIIRKTTK
jgi:hypothetical protein